MIKGNSRFFIIGMIASDSIWPWNVFFCLTQLLSCPFSMLFFNFSCRSRPIPSANCLLLVYSLSFTTARTKHIDMYEISRHLFVLYPNQDNVQVYGLMLVMVIKEIYYHIQMFFHLSFQYAFSRGVCICLEKKTKEN